MLLKYLSLSFRNFKKNKTIHIITIGGFGISMAAVLLLLVFIIGEKNVNKDFPNADSIYRLRKGENALIPESFLDDVPNSVPGVKNICVYSIHERLFVLKKSLTNANCLATSADFLDMFSINFIHRGSIASSWNQNDVILSKSFSKKWFGNENPVGKVLKGEYNDFNIVGVVADPVKNSSLHFDVIMHLKEGFAQYTGDGVDNVTHRMFKSFVQLEKNTDPELVGEQLSGVINKWNLFRNDKIILQPLKDVYFDTSLEDDLPHANVSMIYLLSSIAFVILVLTVFNYINLVVSSGYKRISEVGIRKTIGAGSGDIFKQLLLECMLITLISLLLAAFFPVFLSPVLSDILGKEIHVRSLLYQPKILLPSVSLLFIVGMLSGIFPAIIFSRVSSLKMITRNTKVSSYSGKGSLVVFQFVITIVLIIGVLSIQKQIDFIKNKNLNFDQEMIVRIQLEGNARSECILLKEKIMANSNILAVSLSQGSIMKFVGWGSREIEENGKKKQIDMRMLSIDDEFIDIFGIDLVKGRNIDLNNKNFTCLINEKYYKYLGWDNFEGQKLDDFEVVGIVKDFHFDNLHKEIGLVMLYKSKGGDILNTKLAGNIPETMKYIKKCYAEIEPSMNFKFAFYDDWIQQQYIKEEKQAKAVKVFALFAIIISCIGLVGLIELSTERKIKEIGIRKVNGARIKEVVWMLNANFAKWVIIAIIIASPVGYYTMEKWLENFAYKTTLDWWIFALASIIAFGITLLTVFFQSWQAAARNPVEALRYE